MPDAPITCPYCNAAIPTPAAPPITGKLTCFRCGDAFPWRFSEPPTQPSPRKLGGGEEGTNLEDEVQRHRQARQATATRSVKRAVIVAVALGALGILVGLGLDYFNRPKPSPVANLETAKPVPPAEMPGLGYLPAGTDSVIALQLRPLAVADASIHDVLTRIGIPAEIVDNVDRAIGIGLENVDQLVIGMKLKDGVVLGQIVFVVHARQHYSIEDLADRAKAKHVKRGDRTIYSFPLTKQLPIDLNWWAPNDRVLVASLIPSHLDGIPVDGRKGLDHLAPHVAASMSLLSDDTLLWAVLDSESWDSLARFALGASGRGDLSKIVADPMANLRTAVLGIRMDGEPIATGWFDLKTDGSATNLRNWLLSRYKDEEGSITVGGAGNRVMVRTAAKNFSTALQKAVPDTKKK